MNSAIEVVNGWAGHIAGFEWAMLWQSSLLIGILFVIDFLLRRKVRAAVLYALWPLAAPIVPSEFPQMLSRPERRPFTRG